MINSTLNPYLNSNTSLGIDQAYFSILNLYLNPVIFYAIAWEAYTGNGIPIATLEPHSNTTLKISTKYPLHIYYQSIEADRVYEYCHTTYTFKEHGSYGWNISSASLCSNIYVLHEPTESYLPILAAFIIYVLLAILWTTFKVIIRVIRGKLSPNNIYDDLDRLQEAENATNLVVRTTKFSTRIHSVDTFRGIAILLMIFVNNGGGKYIFFNHSAWFGLSIADLVLPWFAWIMGLMITVSKRTELRLTTSRIKITLYCLRRSAILIFLGLMLNSKDSESLHDLRFPGVLQLLGVSYFVCAILETIFMKPHSQFGRFAMFRDILESWPQWLIMAGIVTTHTLITFLLPISNCPKGYFGPGGEYHFRGKYMNCTAGAAGYIDRLIFGNHTYNHTENFLYGQILRYDPEGLMNTISAIFIVYLGVHAGKILLLYYQCNSRVIRWFLWTAFTGIIAGILCNFETQGGIIPISKRMMTLSYVLICSSFAFLLYALLYVLIDYKQFWNGAPFVYAGINPIFLYVGHVLTKDLFPWSWNIAVPSHASLLAMNRTVTLLGGTFAAAGMMLSYFANSVAFLCISYGVLVGTGAGLAFPPTVYIVTSYFVRLRGLANGLCISGSALGSIFLPPILGILLREYGYRGAVLIMGAVTLNVWASALLYEPVERHMVPASSSNKSNDVDLEAASVTITSPEDEKQSNHVVSSSNTNEKAAPIVPKSASSVALEYYKNTPVQGRTRKISMPMGREITGQMHSTPALHAVPERAADSGKLSKRQKSPFQSPSMSSFNYISTPYHGSTLSALHPERASTLTLNAISSTFARKGTEETNKNEVKEKKNKFFDFSLLRDPIYLVILISNSTNAVSYTNFVILLPAYAISLGFDKNMSSLLLSTVSVLDLIGRIGGSALSDVSIMPKHWYFVGGLFISGISLALLPIVTSYTLLSVYCGIFGLASGIYVGITAVIMADMLGTEKLTSSYGISLFVNGIIQLVGPPICGIIYEQIGSYGPIFSILGIVLVVGASLWGFVPFIRKRQKIMEKESPIEKL